jgi:hypothetical protein
MSLFSFYTVDNGHITGKENEAPSCESTPDISQCHVVEDEERLPLQVAPPMPTTTSDYVETTEIEEEQQYDEWETFDP